MPSGFAVSVFTGNYSVLRRKRRRFGLVPFTCVKRIYRAPYTRIPPAGDYYRGSKTDCKVRGYIRRACVQSVNRICTRARAAFYTPWNCQGSNNERWFILLELRPGLCGNCLPARIRLCRPRDSSGASSGQHRAALRTVFYSGSPSSSAVHAAVCTAS